MGTDTGSDPEGLGLDQYWRRRVIALGGMVGVVGFFVWACAGGGGERKQPLKNAAVASPSVSGASPSIPVATPTVTVTAQATPSPAKEDGDACERDNVVIDMTSTRETFAKDEMPQFRLTVVNTGEYACTFDVGSRSLNVRVTSGAARVWSASGCDQGTGSSIQMLRRGIPYVGTVTWDRKLTSGQCRGDREPARPGTYVAAVKADKIKVRKQIFRLR
ncbi:hypothetical protein ACGFNU_06275 [Spirillospora sp. NPDC048911]|uniref:hypothetical protein n=1 Tax=Spirillospora sp. NPDC048911 TaxID=3364527 RepID=UPI0037174562